LTSYASPAAFFVSPRQIAANQKTLREFNLNASREALTRALEEVGFTREAFESSFTLLDRLQKAGQADPAALADFRTQLPTTSSWWFIIDRFLSSRPYVAAAYLRPAHTPANAAEQQVLEAEIKASGVPVHVTGWSYAMVSLVPWARHELLFFSGGVGGVILIVLGWIYREFRVWLIHTASLVFAIVATITTLKLTGMRLNLLNALAFPLMLGVGVDYGLLVLLAAREQNDKEARLDTALKPLIISGLTSITGFASLMLCQNPSLYGLGAVCTVGAFWCLVSSMLFALPLYFLRRKA
jgi:predicted exporter